MNKTGIEWCTHSWNPMTGCKGPGGIPCPYCYAAKIAKRFKGSKAWPNGFDPTWWNKRLDEVDSSQDPRIIFAGSMTDIFGDWWPENQIRSILNAIEACKQHKFVILSKNPGRMFDFFSNERYNPKRYQNLYVGTSTDGTIQTAGRISTLHKIHDLGMKTVISFEPLLHDPTPMLMMTDHGIAWADWIVIGGQTGPVKIPNPEWVDHIFMWTNMDLPIFVKNNCGDFWKDKPYVHDFPPDLFKIAKSWGKC